MRLKGPSTLAAVVLGLVVLISGCSRDDVRLGEDLEPTASRGHRDSPYRLTTPSAVGGSTTFDFGTAEPAEVADTLARDGRVVIRGLGFETGSAELSSAGYASATKLGQVMSQRPELKVAVVGHTDSTGDFNANVDLSKRRAQAIAQVVQQDFDIAADRMVAVGAGPLVPVGSNETEFGRSQNRRVEFVVLQ